MPRPTLPPASVARTERRLHGRLAGSRSLVIGAILALRLTAPASFAAPLVWRPLPDLPDPLGLAGAFAGVSSGALLVAGGANFPNGMPWDGGAKVWQDRVWV